MNTVLMILGIAGVAAAYFGLKRYAGFSLEKNLRAAGCENFTPSSLPEATFTPNLVTIGNLQFQNNLAIQMFPEGVAIPVRKNWILIPYSRLSGVQSFGYTFAISDSELKCSFGYGADEFVASKIQDQR